MNPSPKTQRIACLWFPDWPVQYRLAAKPELARTVLLLMERTGRGEFVVFGNRWAGKRGISRGMPLAEARSLVSGRDVVHVEPMQPAADRAALEELAVFCERYSPCVGVEEAESPQSLVLDISGIAHLFGGEPSLLRHMQDELTAKRFTVRIAVGDSVGAAWAAAHYLASEESPAPCPRSSWACSDRGENSNMPTASVGMAPRSLANAEQPVVLPSGQCDVLFDLPIEGLRLGESVVEKLHRLGIRTIRQVRSLKRSSLPVRFGSELACGSINCWASGPS